MLAQRNPYVCRARNDRVASRPSPGQPAKLCGILPRWSEHVRDLERHRRGLAPKDRIRRRYTELRRGIRASCLNIVVYCACQSIEVACREALSISLVQPRSNGNELIHFSGLVRPPQNRSSKPRKRLKGSSRKNARRAFLRKQTEQWGEDVQAHSRTVIAAHDATLAKDFEKYTNRKLSPKRKQASLGVTFHEMYRNGQLHPGCLGPINLYRATHVLLFVKACSDHRVCKKVSFNTLLACHGETIDYLSISLAFACMSLLACAGKGL